MSEHKVKWSTQSLTTSKGPSQDSDSGCKVCAFSHHDLLPPADCPLLKSPWPEAVPFSSQNFSKSRKYGMPHTFPGTCENQPYLWKATATYSLSPGEPSSREDWWSSPWEKLASRPASGHVHTAHFICLYLFLIYKVMGPYSPSFIYWLIHSFIYYALGNLASISSPLGVHHPMCSQRSRLPVQHQCVKCGDGRMLGMLESS